MGSSEQVMTAELDLDDLEQTDTGIGQPYDTAMRCWVESCSTPPKPLR